MRDNQCHAVLTFWYDRQQAEKSPTFRFTKYLIQDDLVDANPQELLQDLIEIPDSKGPAYLQKKIPKKKKVHVKGKGKASKGKGKMKAKVEETSAEEFSSSDKDDMSTLQDDSLNGTYEELEGLRHSQLCDDLSNIHEAGPSKKDPRQLVDNVDEVRTMDVVSHADPKEMHTKDLFHQLPSLSQPELQEISDQLAGKGPTEMNLLILQAFHALKVQSQTPSPPKAEHIPQLTEENGTKKRFQSPSLESIPGSTTKKSRALHSTLGIPLNTIQVTPPVFFLTDISINNATTSTLAPSTLKAPRGLETPAIDPNLGQGKRLQSSKGKHTVSKSKSNSKSKSTVQVFVDLSHTPRAATRTTESKKMGT